MTFLLVPEQAGYLRQRNPGIAQARRPLFGESDSIDRAGKLFGFLRPAALVRFLQEKAVLCCCRPKKAETGHRLTLALPSRNLLP